MGSPQPTGLRRRLGVLERAHSLSNHSDDSRNKQKAIATTSRDDHHAEETSGHSHSSLTDYETYSDSSESEDSPDGVQTPVPEPRHAAPASSGAARPEPPPYSLEPTSRAWYEFDLAVIAALVMPIGNWLTGGEHIKNVLVIVLILFYLHQVIEMPWALYLRSRPRQPAPSSIPSPTNSKETRYHSKAVSELRFYEFFFLLFAATSPFIGAYTLRYLSRTLVDTDILSSWFNTSLFVIATGVRPWSHLIQRLNRRITDLHDIIHFPTPDSSSETAEAMRGEMEDLKIKIQVMQKALAELNQKVAHDTDEVYDYVDDAVEMVEKAAKKHERKCEKQEGRVKDLEVSLESMRKMRRPRPQSLSFSEHQTNRSSSSLSLPLVQLPLPPKLTSTLAYVASVLPPWLPLPALLPKNVLWSEAGSSSPTAPPQYEPKHSPSATVTRYSILSLSSPDGLATIPEEAGFQSQVQTPVSPLAASSSSSVNSSNGVSRSRGGASSSSLNGTSSSGKKPLGNLSANGNGNGKKPNSVSASSSPSTSAFVSAPSASGSGSGSSPTSRNPALTPIQTQTLARGRSSSRSPNPSPQSRSQSPSPDTANATVTGADLPPGKRGVAQSPPEYGKLGLFQRLLVRVLYIVMFPLREFVRIIWGAKARGMKGSAYVL